MLRRTSVTPFIVALALTTSGCRRSPPFERFEAVAMGGFHACVIASGGQVACWGTNHEGQVGSALNPQRTTVFVAGLSHVRQLALGQAHTCALHGDGTVSCWGRNTAGELGDGTTTSRSIPARVGGITDAVEVAAGGMRTCVRLRGGGVRCFGLIGRGRDFVLQPREMPALSGATQLALGSTHACALLSDGTARCWGSNLRGELGDGTTEDRAEPTPVKGLVGAAQLGVGGRTSCARLVDGTVRCWGYSGGFDGVGATREEVLTPGAVAGLSDVAELGLGEFHRCVRRRDGAVACWGSRFWCEIGDGVNGVGATASVPAPVTVPALPSSRQLAVGWRQACSIGTDGSLFCWGDSVRTPTGECLTPRRIDGR